MCHQIPDVEWSGILMYKLTGNFSTGNFQCIVKDIFLMNIGSSTYTEYEFSERFIKYRMEHPESLDYETAHIHSHSTMNTFFSGTDIQELQDNAPNHNYYLSLIVNNAFEPTAKIAFVGEQEKKEDVVRSFFGDNGKLYKFNHKETTKEKVLFTYDCDIEADINIKVDNYFKERLKEVIIEKKEAEEKAKLEKKAKKVTTPTYPYRGGPMGFRGNYYSEGDEWEGWYNANHVTIVEDDEDEMLEEAIADSISLQIDCGDNLDEAMFKANIDYKEKGDEFIIQCGNFYRSILPYKLGYTGEYDIKKKDMEATLEKIFFYEDEYPEFVNKLSNEFIK